MAKTLTIAEATDNIVLEKNSTDSDNYLVDATDWIGGRGTLANSGVALSSPVAVAGSAITTASPTVVQFNSLNTAKGTFIINGGALPGGGAPGVSTATLTLTFSNGEIKTMPMTFIIYA